jgi:hypothetical protein
LLEGLSVVRLFRERQRDERACDGEFIGRTEERKT